MNVQNSWRSNYMYFGKLNSLISSNFEILDQTTFKTYYNSIMRHYLFQFHIHATEDLESFHLVAGHASVYARLQNPELKETVFDGFAFPIWHLNNYKIVTMTTDHYGLSYHFIQVSRAFDFPDAFALGPVEICFLQFQIHFMNT